MKWRLDLISLSSMKWRLDLWLNFVFMKWRLNLRSLFFLKWRIEMNSFIFRAVKIGLEELVFFGPVAFVFRNKPILQFCFVVRRLRFKQVLIDGKRKDPISFLFLLECLLIPLTFNSYWFWCLNCEHQLFQKFLRFAARIVIIFTEYDIIIIIGGSEWWRERERERERYFNAKYKKTATKCRHWCLDLCKKIWLYVN